MQKIMFNDKYGLTSAVLNGRKTMTRRIIKGCESDTLPYGGIDGTKHFVISTNDGIFTSTYGLGEVVAVAQSYETLANSGTQQLEKMMENPSTIKKEFCGKGWENKMFVKAEYMPHQIQITDIKVERLQDISKEDCLKEGIEFSDMEKNWFFTNVNNTEYHAPTCRAAFASLIDKVSGKGTWESNPYVFAYAFELVD